MGAATSGSLLDSPPLRSSPVAASSDVSFDKPRFIGRAPTHDQRGTLRVVSWNIDRGQKLARIASELAANPADLIVLQEVDWNAARSARTDVAAELAQRLGCNGVYGIEFEELGQEDASGRAFIGQATLSCLPLQSARVLRFKTQSDFWRPRAWLPSGLPLMQRRNGSRIALVAEYRFAGQLLVVYNVHLESRSAGFIQMAQIDEIVRDSARYPARSALMIIGDFNTKYLPSLFLHRLERSGFRSVLGNRIERTHTIAMTLDWIFFKGPLRAVAGRVRRDLQGSDHYALYADLVRTA